MSILLLFKSIVNFGLCHYGISFCLCTYVYYSCRYTNIINTSLLFLLCDIPDPGICEVGNHIYVI